MFRDLESQKIVNCVIGFGPIGRDPNPCALFCFLELVLNIARSGSAMSDKELYSGMKRLHILCHASKGQILGLSIIEELERHGYRLNPGTFYPILHAARKGYLRSVEKTRRTSGEAVLSDHAGPGGKRLAKTKVRELVGELFED